MENKYYKSSFGGRWLPISHEYFETIIVDFMSRPEVPDKLRMVIKPKKHNNHNGVRP